MERWKVWKINHGFILAALQFCFHVTEQFPYCTRVHSTLQVPSIFIHCSCISKSKQNKSRKHCYMLILINTAVTYFPSVVLRCQNFLRERLYRAVMLPLLVIYKADAKSSFPPCVLLIWAKLKPKDCIYPEAVHSVHGTIYKKANQLILLRKSKMRHTLCTEEYKARKIGAPDKVVHHLFFIWITNF